MKIASIDKDVKDVLGSSYYRIPRFQRPYSWERENISDFWADTVQDSDADYFIGSMVVFKANSDTYGIVDGQQRLTTITMILCALRNSLQKEGFTDLASGTHQLIERKDIDNNARYILSTESSFPYFQEYVQKFGIAEITTQVKDEEKNIQIVYSQIKNYIDSTVSSVKSNTTLNATAKKKRLREELISIRDKILGLKLIFVELDNDDDAYVIFETLNTRGKDLNAADLVKSLLTRLTKASGVVDTTKIKWERIVATIEGSSQDLHTEVFLHHYWLSKYDYVTLKKLYKRIRKTIDKSKAKGFLNELGTDASTYREIHETNFRSWRGDEKSIKKSLDALLQFRVKQQVPMVLSIMRDYKAGRLKRKNVEKVLATIENFHFIFTAVTSQRSSGGISQMYAASAKRLVNAPAPEKKPTVLNDLADKLKDKIPVYAEFEANFEEIYVTNRYTKLKDLVKYILSCIHAHQNKAIKADYSQMTIEHILSQSPTAASGVDDQLLGQLGNLILVPKEINEELSNKSFKEKKKILEANKVYLDPIIEKASVWGPAQIKKRTKWLAKLAYNTVWKL